MFDAQRILADAIDALPDKGLIGESNWLEVHENGNDAGLLNLCNVIHLKALVADWRKMDAERQARIDLGKQLLAAARDLAKSLKAPSTPFIP